MRQEGEASVEEILESIKKVIARDNRASALDTRRRRETEGLEAAPEPADEEEADEVLDLAAADYVEQAPEFNDRIGENADYDHGEDEDHDDSPPADTPLLTDSAREAMRENLAALAMLAEPGVPPQIVRSGETSLEGLTRELLRPMLAEWLDKNLPTMVERMVKDEIARIAGKRG
jgi:cell pole-organizing protein PopZ